LALQQRRSGDPERLGRYRVLGRLGRGGQGIVYLAAPAAGATEERVAIKVLTGGLNRSFERELAAARQVAEFCTARVIAADLDHDPPYVVSEFIDGPALAAVAPLPGAALTRLAIATATALTAIHRAGVVHRDFKPDNVLMAPDGPRVIDFGIARLTDSTTAGSGIVGTPRYMAPEQFGDGPIGPPADVFAWGCTMAYAATARSPFGGGTIPAVIHRILSAEPDLRGLPEPLRSLVARCLSKNPGRRPTAKQTLLHLLGEGEQEAAARALRHGANASPAGRRMPTPPRETLPGAAAGQGRAPGEPREGAVSRRALLLGTGVVTAGLAVGLWRWGPSVVISPQPERSGTPLTGPQTPLTGPRTPPPGEPQALASALQTALAATPMADFVAEGVLTQSNFRTDAKGKLVFDPFASDGAGSVNFAMTVTVEEREDLIVVIGEGDDAGTYLNGKPAKQEPESVQHAHLVSYVSSVGIVAELVALTREVRAENRVYTGSLATSEAPHGLRSVLAEIVGGRPDEEMARTNLNWQLVLDDRDRPRTFTFVWRAPIVAAVLASTWTTTYSGWRTGSITRPQ